MIQWYPGHMAKTLRQIEENVKYVDIIIELVDARAPAASQNPMLESLIRHKTRVVLLMKSDLADDYKTNKWVQFFQNASTSTYALSMNVNEKRDMTKLLQVLQDIGEKEFRKRVDKGIQKKTIRMLIAGIPNVGKSTLINRLANKRIAKIGDRPGVTRQPQWIKVGKQFELLDTPGVLWPKFEDEIIGIKLAAIGSIKYELVPLQDVAAFVLKYLGDFYPASLKERYNLTDYEDMWEVFNHIGKLRGTIERGGNVNFDKVAEVVLHDFRSGRIGKVTLEEVQ